MRYLLTSLILLLLSCSAEAQDSTTPVFKFWIEFTDKDNTPYSIHQPEVFLTERALARREKQGIAIRADDLPVDPAYVQGIGNLGFTVLHRSRWFNGISVATEDSSLILQVVGLPYVANHRPVSYLKIDPSREMVYEDIPPSSNKLRNDYGPSYNQIDMVRGDLLHDIGLEGQGVLIAVLDAGFSGTEEHEMFDHLRKEGRIVDTYDFVAPGTSVYDHSSHGTAVLSIMAGYLPGKLVGTAPKASYMLLRSEDADTELTIEEHNWVAAAEYADIAGADILNTSLGYTDFDHPDMSYTYEDMDGATAFISRGASIAAQKGMLVVNSAGNSGQGTWGYINAPADAFDVLSVGAVTQEVQYAAFSSRGPSFDGRVKPEVAAQGQGTVIASFSEDRIRTGSGTSLAAPIIAGMAACLMQAWPQRSSEEVHQAIIASAHQYHAPDTFLGYGIPNFMTAYMLLADSGTVPNPGYNWQVFPNPTAGVFFVTFISDREEVVDLELVDMSGRPIWRELVHLKTDTKYLVTIDGLVEAPPGLYLLRVHSTLRPETLRIIKGF